MRNILLCNFGGPRSLEEVESFLVELLTDPEVIRTPLPRCIDKVLFKRIAKHRAPKVACHYQEMGGRSPIYADTERMAERLQKITEKRVICFHRYLPNTHQGFLEEMATVEGEICALPLFPQFSYATTGSVAKYLHRHLNKRGIHWVKSYAEHPAYIQTFQEHIRGYLQSQGIREEECTLLFSAHGLPQSFVDAGDPYEEECKSSYEAIMKGFSSAASHLAYQSKFGPGKWLRPYTDEVCLRREMRRLVVIIPLSFTSEHLETLYEIEKLYMPMLRARRLSVYRCPAIGASSLWEQTLATIVHGQKVLTDQLLR